MAYQDDLVGGIQELREAYQNQADALPAWCGAIDNHTTILTHQTALLDEILDILTTEPKGESPLVEALKKLVDLIENQSAILTRIEASLQRSA